MFPARYFKRDDERDDELFYGDPRLVVHIDEGAIQATTELYREYLRPNSDVLDLMSSWRSHLPIEVAFSSVVGLGMNALELRENPQLSACVVQNLNKNQHLPFDNDTFDGCVLTVSVQYLAQPIAVFAEVGRVLRAGAPFLTVFSNRMFPTKAVAIWRSLDDAGHTELVSRYYQATNKFDQIETLDRNPRRFGRDPLYAVVGRKHAA